MQRELGTGTVTGNLVGKHDDILRLHGGLHPIICGHLIFEGSGLDPRYSYFTNIREPVERAVSWLHFIVNNHRPDELTPGLWEQAEVFLRTGDELGEMIPYHLNNHYVNHFSSISSTAQMTDESKLELALQNIQQYDVIGDFGDLPQFTRNISNFLKIPVATKLEHTNITSFRPEITQISTNLRERLFELNNLDLQFYQKLKSVNFHANSKRKVENIVERKWEVYNEPHLPTEKPKTIQVVAVKLKPESYVLDSREILDFSLSFSTELSIEKIDLIISIYDEEGRLAFESSSDLSSSSPTNLCPGVYETHFYLVPDLPEGEYSVRFSFQEFDNGSSHHLGGVDYDLRFRVQVDRKVETKGYSALSAKFLCHQISSDPIVDFDDATGFTAVSGTFEKMHPNETLWVPVEIVNRSLHDWVGTIDKPLQLKHEWMMAGDNSWVDAPKPHFIIDRIDAQSSFVANINIKAPYQPGPYDLRFILAQGDSDLASFGFASDGFTVNVIKWSEAKRYGAADVRLFSTTGQPLGSVKASSGADGFLTYGPFCDLPRGDYLVVFEGSVVDPGTSSYADVAVNEHVLIQKPLDKEENTNVIAQLAFSLERNSSRVEFRIWVDRHADIQLSGIQVVPTRLD
ncbi:hypothetical protein ABENE_10750 [Asticcacaulis benevestitus DSM 16100 = ATCC BAA-896]|uniref:Wzt C-terminal domain-containing protein n=1 Tax=Asticcacaulis benevestitus DSM 16100 = ATCC BAA-896 TaxID=1121022 RepID=V4RII7_9CAUL|nr:hypothetical protein ABENE_10750 [Asticcacaulis benevestitus DSM 16100 = ATCC BAA-896]